MSHLCPDQRRPCPAPDKCQTNCHFDTATAALTSPATAAADALKRLRSAMEHPIARETFAQPHQPAQRESLPTIGLDLDALLTAAGCQRLCMFVICLCLAALACLGLLAVLWHYDAPLRATWADVCELLTYVFYM